MCSRSFGDNRAVEWDTEVWSWGEGSQGQLGHGDLLDRLADIFILGE